MKPYEQMTREELIEELARKDEDLVEALWGKEERYRTLFMSMREGFLLSKVLYDEAGTPSDYLHLDMNPSFERILGLHRDHLINRSLTEAVPNYSSFWFDIFRQVASSGEPSYGCFFSTPFRRHFEVFAFRPKVDQYAVLVTDITERIETYLALRQSEARLRLFIEHAPARLAMFDRDMNYLCVSRRYRDDYTHSLSDITGLCHYDLFPDLPEKWCEAHRRGLAGEVVSSDGDLVKYSDGSLRWVSWKVEPWYDGTGGIGGIVLITEDITELKEAEAALRQSEQRYRAIVETQTEFVDRYLPGGILTYVNHATAAAMGKKPEEVLGTSFHPLLHEEDRERVVKSIEALSARNPSVTVEARVMFPDGIHWLQCKHMAITGTAGNIVEYQATGRDITERKQMQDDLIKHQNELKLANELLEQRVKERTADLEAAMRAQESFSYSVSHDLRAPLRHINSFSTVLLEQYGRDLPPEAQDYLGRICAASRRMGALIDHLLELSRVTRAELRPRVVDMSDLAVRTLRMFQETEPGRRTDIAIEQGLKVMGDKSLLMQLLQNLLGNAWKYTSKKESARIEFGKTVVSGQETYYVRDNGAGFDMTYREKLFKAFERLHGAEFEGIGIGLATAQQIIQRHGGDMWAEGAVDQGATFYFTLPV